MKEYIEKMEKIIPDYAKAFKKIDNSIYVH